MNPGQSRPLRVALVAVLLAVVVLILARQWMALLLAAVFVGWVLFTGALWALVMRTPRRHRRERELRDYLAGDAYDDLPTQRRSWDQPPDHDGNNR